MPVLTTCSGMTYPSPSMQTLLNRIPFASSQFWRKTRENDHQQPASAIGKRSLADQQHPSKYQPKAEDDDRVQGFVENASAPRIRPLIGTM